MVTRTEGDQSIVLEVEGDQHGVVPYTCFKWSDSYYSLMVKGEAPRITPNPSVMPRLPGARMGQAGSAGAYIGVPLTYQDGELFGALCAMDPLPQPREIEGELPLVEMVAKMLSGVLSAEWRAIDAERQKERRLAEADTDPLTGLFNRTGWDRMIEIEAERCRRYGNSAFLVLADLDGLNHINESLGMQGGDKLLRRTAKVLSKSVRDCDVVARLGGDEFGILGTPCNPVMAEDLLRRVRKALERAGIRASVGMATKVPALHLRDLWSEAEQVMNGEKTARKLRSTATLLRRMSRAKTYPG